MLLLSMLAAFGLLLTLVGIFSMTAYAVARRTREIVVRMAFGARPVQVVGVMIRDAVWPLPFGIAAGLAVAYYCFAARGMKVREQKRGPAKRNESSVMASSLWPGSSSAGICSNTRELPRIS
jgi:ABC-type antimicrobial peptide transport system permease subunit